MFSITDVLGQPLTDDVVQPFQIETSSLRGRLVRLGGALDDILKAHDYPEPAARMLGESVILAAILANALKYDGIFTLQTKGDGPLSTTVADVTSAGDMRGYASVDAARLPAGGHCDVPSLLGSGVLAFTVDQGTYTDRYQGIVELTGSSLAECMQYYFRQSEQIDAGLKVAIGRCNGGWRAGGLMVQRLPDASAAGSEPIVLASDRADDWRRAMLLMETCTDAELLDPTLEPNALLYRLFHEDGVRVYTPSPLRARCRCSRGRVERVLASLPRAEIEDCKVDGKVFMTCEFCNTTYTFDDDDLAALYAAAGQG